MIGKPKNTGQKHKGRKNPLCTELDDVSNLTPDEIKALVHELHAHQVQLSSQVEELKEAHRELELSRDKYQQLYDTAPVGYLTLDKDCSILEANATAEKLLAAEVRVLLGAKFTDFVSSTDRSQDIFYLHMRKTIVSPQHQECELEMRRRDGSRFPARLQTIVIAGTAGTPRQFRVTVTDMTEHDQAEKSILNSRRRMAEVLESIADGFFALDRDSRFTYVNKRAASNLGSVPEDLVGQSIWDRFPAITRTEFGTACRRAILTSQAQYLEASGIAGTGWYNVSIYPTAEGISVYWQDITDRKIAEEALRESQQKYRALTETTSDFIWETDAQGKYTYCSPQMKSLWGFDPKDRIGQTPFDFLPPERKEPGIRTLLATVQSQSPFAGVEVSSFDSQGNAVSLEVSGVPYFDTAGKFMGFRGFTRDITARKRAQEDLRKLNEELEMRVKERTAKLAESEEKYRVLVENADQAVVVFQDGLVKFFNSKAIEISGYTREELTARPIGGLIHPDDRQMVVERYMKRMEGKEVASSYAFRMLHKDGHILWVNIDAVRLSWEDRPAVMGLIGDITERRNMEQELKAYARRIIQVQEEERKRIAYELHDDTAQYLAILKLQLDSLVNSGKIQAPEIMEKLRYLQKDASRAVDDVRRYSHELRPGVLEHLGLQAALEQIAEDNTKVGQIEVEVNAKGIAPKLPEDIKLGFFRIAQEAINNCRRHAQTPTAYINLKYSKNRMQMTVTDFGVGFDVEKVSSRIGESGSLGLTSMQERARLIGAEFKIESKPGKGTAITVEMPL